MHNRSVRHNIRLVGMACAMGLAALGIGQVAVDRLMVQGARADRPAQFEVDPFWPKQLPNNWIMGSVVGVSVDANDRIWMIHRPSSLVDNEKAAALNPPRAECCFPAPPVLVFDQAGNLVKSWAAPSLAATNGLIPSTASSSITRATCGSAATGPKTPRS